MSDYQTFPFRLVDIGLNLRDAPDKVGEGKWTQLENIKPTLEGSISPRPGRSLDFDTQSGLAVHTIKDIGPETTLIGTGTTLYRNTGVDPNYDINDLSGNPLATVNYRPLNSSVSWTYIGDYNRMIKVKDDGTLFQWGITAPTLAASAVTLGSGNLDSSVAGAIAYDWRYTYFSTLTGAESNPSPEMTAITVVQQTAQVTVYSSDDAQVDTIRLYRRGGLLPNGWTLVAQAGNINGELNDNNADSAIVFSQPLAIDNDVPFTTVDDAGSILLGTPLPYVWGPFNGKYIFGAGDPNQHGFLYWTNVDRPDSASPANSLEVTNPLEGLQMGFIYGSNPYVWSRLNLYAIDFGSPFATPVFTTRKTPVGKGIAGPRAFAIGPYVWFVSTDGVYVTNCQGPPTSISEDSIRPIFEGAEVEGILPIDFDASEDIRLYYAKKELHLFYSNTEGVTEHLVYHTIYERWRKESTSDWVERVVYEKEAGDTGIGEVLTGSAAGITYFRFAEALDDEGSPIPCQGRTGSIDFGDPQGLKELGNLIIDADPQGSTITITPYLNAETSTLPPMTITGTGRQKFTMSLSDTYCYSVAFDMTWSGQAVIYQFSILWRPDEERIVHWEFPETTHGLSGWQHVRDLYLTYRATSPITLTMTIDGVEHVYTQDPLGNDVLPSTDGERRKAHVWLDPVRGKVFRYALDSAEPFQLYGYDCEARIKQWNTALGYQEISPFRVHQKGAFSPERGPVSI